MAEYHFIGIGGIGMGKLASLLLTKGASVSGSDLVENKMVRSLKDQGAQIFIGHDAKNVQQARQVVYSSAVRQDNPELCEAKKNKLRILRRAELLAELMEDYQSITVAGAHGKTTTTSMIAHILLCAGLDPTVALGGVFQQGSYQENLGKGEYFVAELDESDGSFLLFSPDISVITNIDFEHVDYYGDWDTILKSYAQFIEQTHADGIIIACGEDERLKKKVVASERRAVLYGFGVENKVYAADVCCENGQTNFSCYSDGKMLGEVSLHILGRHNILNALAAIAAALQIKIPFQDIADALKSYRGVHRRFELKGRWQDVVLYDDYAHHPTEIRATLKAAKQVRAERIIAAFQPHRYTRIKFLWEEFKGAFIDADVVFVTDIYAASEIESSGMDINDLCVEIAERSGCEVHYVNKKEMEQCVVSQAQTGDLVITLGAGDITKISDRIATRLQEKFKMPYG